MQETSIMLNIYFRQHKGGERNSFGKLTERIRFLDNSTRERKRKRDEKKETIHSIFTTQFTTASYTQKTS